MATITDLGQVTESRLCWPDTKPRSAHRTGSPFKSEVARAAQGIQYEMDWRTLLGSISGLAPDKQLVLCEHAYRSMSREAFGNEAKQRDLNLAIEVARQELRGG